MRLARVPAVFAVDIQSRMVLLVELGNLPKFSLELGKSVNEKLKPVMDELGKLGTITTKYNDWIVQ